MSISFETFHNSIISCNPATIRSVAKHLILSFPESDMTKYRGKFRQGYLTRVTIFKNITESFISYQEDMPSKLVKEYDELYEIQKRVLLVSEGKSLDDVNLLNSKINSPEDIIRIFIKHDTSELRSKCTPLDILALHFKLTGVHLCYFFDEMEALEEFYGAVSLLSGNFDENLITVGMWPSLLSDYPEVISGNDDTSKKKFEIPSFDAPDPFSSSFIQKLDGMSAFVEYSEGKIQGRIGNKGVESDEGARAVAELQAGIRLRKNIGVVPRLCHIHRKEEANIILNIGDTVLPLCKKCQDDLHNKLSDLNFWTEEQH